MTVFCGKPQFYLSPSRVHDCTYVPFPYFPLFLPPKTIPFIVPPPRPQLPTMPTKPSSSPMRWQRLLIPCGGGGGALKCGWNNTGERATPFLCMWGLRLGRNNQRHSLHTRVSVFLSFSFRLFRVLGCETLICPGIRLIHFFASFSTYNAATFLFLPYENVAQHFFHFNKETDGAAA